MPVDPSNYALKLKRRLSQRVVHGVRLLTGIEQEILMWMAVKHPAIGYDKMFDTELFKEKC